MFSKLENYIGTALIADGEEIDYAKLVNVVKIIEDKISYRALMFVFCTNSPGAIAGYVACMRKHIVAAMVDNGLDDDLSQRLIERYQPKYLWLPTEKADKYDGEVILSIWEYSLLQLDGTNYSVHDDLALLMTTSGSTGSPKLVRQSYKNLLTNTNAIIDYLNISSSERAITSLPMSYVYGLSIINTHLSAGATVILTDLSIFNHEFWCLFDEEGATSLAGVPYTYEMLDRLRFNRMNYPSLRTMTQAGGKLPPELHRKFASMAKDKSINFIVMYGAAEATARMAYLPANKSLEKCGSIGIAIKGGCFKLLDDNGKTINDADKEGELVYYGDNVCMGYAENGTDLCKGDEMKGCLFTGDMAKRDSDGYYYIVGRKKRFIKIYGKRVSLDETEILLKENFPTSDITCAGKDDLMCIFTTDKKIISDITKVATYKLRLNNSAFRAILLKELPISDTGKVLYKKLEKYYD